MAEDPPLLPLPYALSAPNLARQHLLTWAAHLPDNAMDDALLLTSELVTNAVRHGAPEVALQVTFDPPHITVVVIDGGRQVPVLPPQPAAKDSPSGRGLRLVDEIATRWGITRESTDHTCVWFQIEERD
jgi:anti-sigma regulatory factor (Ser/Thr protein kinase)